MNRACVQRPTAVMYVAVVMASDAGGGNCINGSIVVVMGAQKERQQSRETSISLLLLSRDAKTSASTESRSESWRQRKM
ncbi:hypothetical protein Mapa_003772 [Marchantia paleacea]|nr:hypothetical protein Mapa_003772 [Marchantia paleacea]